MGGLTGAVGLQPELAAGGRRRGDVKGGIGEGEGREGLDDEVGAVGAGLDEGGGEGEDGADAEGGVEAGGDGLGLGEDADGGLVAGLDGEDRPGSTEQGGVAQQGRGAEIGGHADALQHGGGGQHGGRVGEGGREVVLAAADGRDAGLREGRLQERDVLGLGAADGLEVGELQGRDAQPEELVVAELGEALLVEGVLEVLESEGTKDSSVQAPNRRCTRGKGKKNIQLEHIQVTETERNGSLLLTL